MALPAVGSPRVPASNVSSAEARRSRASASTDHVEDAKQNVRKHLLDGALADYGGRGDLRAWLRVTLTRELLRLVGGDKRQVRLDTGEMANQVGSGSDPETQYLRTLYQDEF